VLLAGAGLLLRSLSSLRDVAPGFRSNGVLTMQVSPSRTKYPEGPQIRDFYQRLMERVRGLPGVTGVGAISTLLLSETPSSGTFTLEDRPPFPPAEQIEATIDAVSPSFFRAMNVKIKYGRLFDYRDRQGAPLSAIINATFAESYWPGRDPVGQRTFLRQSRRTQSVDHDCRCCGGHAPSRASSPGTARDVRPTSADAIA